MQLFFSIVTFIWRFIMAEQINWGAAHTNADGTTTVSAGTYNGTSDHLSKIGSVFSDGLDNIGFQINDLVSQLNDDPANAAILAKLQPLMLSKNTMINLGASIVNSDKKSDDFITQQM
jgi:hypothetical protein